MSKKILFITDSKVDERLIIATSLKFSKIKKESVNFLTISNFLKPKLSNNESNNYDLGYKIIELNSKIEIEDFLINLDNDNIVSINFPINYKSLFIINILKKNNLHTIMLCQHFTPLRKKSIYKKIYYTIKYPIYTLRYYFFIYKKKKEISYSPETVFCAGNYSYNFYKKKKSINLIKAYHYDFQKFINLKDALKKNVIKKPYIVFVRDVWPEIHPDLMNKDIYLAQDTYGHDQFLTCLDNFFKNLQDIFKLDVVIANHPRMIDNSDILSNKYSIFDNRTENLILHSSLVIVSSSNAINFALLSYKPILFYSYNGFTSNHKEHIFSRSKYLKKNVININNKKYDKSLLSNEFKVDKNIYNKYINDFIIDTNTSMFKKNFTNDIYFDFMKNI